MANPKKIHLQDAVLEDAEFVLYLKNQPYVRKASYSQKNILWEEHLKWFKENYKYFKIICLGNYQIGYVRVHKGDSTGDIHIALLKEHHGRGIGTKVIKQMVKKHKHLTTQVLISNKPSRKIFEKAGFKEVGKIKKNNKIAVVMEK